MIDKTILHRLFCLHYSEMIRLARTLMYDYSEAEDIVQDIFVRLMQSDILPADDKVRAYLMTAVRNGCINRIRKKSITNQFRELYSMDIDSDWQHIEQRMETIDAICDYAENHLQEPHLTIFRLRFEDDMKLKDIANQLGMNLKTVFKYLSQSIDEIQKHFTI
ncbi:MAG: sigma-70 family RNA polymerase sigma factor [Bacteroidaceae bacterium]|nr:sigma-70 family RNA polymerase sigma factor [Bacteroidaceae bacterium]